MNKVYKAPRLMVAATGSSKGKTTITSCLLKLIKDRGIDVHGGKCGPDYIDPMYHEAVIGIPSKNLDPFFCDSELLAASFIEGIGEITVVEACMGLYDGLGTSSAKSPYEVATILDMPIILIVDAYQKGYSIIAEILGFLGLDSKKLIKGIFLNRISESYFDRLAPVIEAETGIEVVGYLPNIKEEIFESRHLGLKSVEENLALDKINELAKRLSNTLNLDRILALANSAKPIKISMELKDYKFPNLSGIKIGVASDKAFNFYYKDNLDALRYSGAEIIFFSPLKDAKLPENLDAIYIGGGYPEIYLDQLDANLGMRHAIKDFVEEGKCLFAECGGFMYLMDAIEGKKMVGIFDGTAKNMGKLVRFGYVDIYFDELSVKGHEFHHFDVENPGDRYKVVKASNRACYNAFRCYKNCIAGFPHLYFMSNPDIVGKLFR